MIRFTRIMLAVLAVAILLVFFIGCDTGDDGTPSQSPPNVAGTYYAIADFGSGDQSVMLVLQISDPANVPLDDGYYDLEGFVSYGDSIYDVAGATEDDTVNFTWTTLQGPFSFAGNIFSEGLRGSVAGLGGTIGFTAYRETGASRSIAGHWEGGFQGGCYPPGGEFIASFYQTESTIAGTLFVVSNEPDMG
ncbi:hypothetical protein KKG05_05140, partial [bacterium]|nr:hypothetical protein [bacterium]